MTTLDNGAIEYFARINPLAKKIIQERFKIQESNEEVWDTLTFEAQEELVDDHFFDNSIAEKYASHPQPEDVPDVFPQLKVNGGEKIIVDFDNDDCLTWRDEHSGPFSWMSRSQQDLNIFEDEQPGESCEEREKKSVQRKSKKAYTPERDSDVPLAYKPEKSIWQSPFLTADRGSEADEIFQKFGIRFTNGREEEQEQVSPSLPPSATNVDEERLLLSKSPSHSTSTQESPQPVQRHAFEHVAQSVEEVDFTDQGSKRNSNSHTKKSPLDEVKSWRRSFSKKDKVESEQSLILDLDMLHLGSQETSDWEHPITSQPTTNHHSPALEEARGQVNLALDESIDDEHHGNIPTTSLFDSWGADLTEHNAEEEEAADVGVSSAKTGFDFLDNW